MSSGGKEPHQEESPPAAVDGDVLRTLAGLNVQAERPIVNRTRRAIRVADETRRIQGKRGRRQAGIALFALGGILVLLAPALWISLDDLLGGEHWPFFGSATDKKVTARTTKIRVRSLTRSGRR
jgi:hypothetical protein